MQKRCWMFKFQQGHCVYCMECHSQQIDWQNKTHLGNLYEKWAKDSRTGEKNYSGRKTLCFPHASLRHFFSWLQHLQERHSYVLSWMGTAPGDSFRNLSTCDLLVFVVPDCSESFHVGHCLDSWQIRQFYITQFYFLLLKGFNHMLKDAVPCS